MLLSMALRSALKSTSVVLRECGVLSRLKGTCASLPFKHGACTSVITGPSNSNNETVLTGIGSFTIQPVRNYARAVRKKKPVMQSQLSDLSPTMLKMEYAAVPLAQTADDLVKRLLTLELASHSEKLRLKTEQLIAKVQRDEADRSSTEVKVAILTSKIRNYQEHLHKHTKDKANKRRMLMAIDRRKKLLKHLRVTRYDAFEHVCQQLGITYTFPPEYYRHATRRWLAKKALCIKVFKEVQKQKLEQRKKMKQTLAPILAEPARTTAIGTQ
ncbi:28S ribosomal protein S15, mitochondrial-like [Coregonus clupeaformis]|uniref:28S ribosomal protein S15, mitochondrial-like n=1 Tax=Coregonus clupeaformis TaxID=59861 RepID=UPI001BE0BF16|nr:28S ribosomal protein S15, mitochondrial-like [Coregonus clupeaformis]